MRRHTLALPLAMAHDSAQHSVRSLVIPKVVLFIAHDLDQGGVETRKKHWISIINASVYNPVGKNETILHVELLRKNCLPSHKRKYTSLFLTCYVIFRHNMISLSFFKQVRL